jgi:hypothetical protein
MVTNVVCPVDHFKAVLEIIHFEWHSQIGLAKHTDWTTTTLKIAVHTVTHFILWTNQWTSRMTHFISWTKQWTSRMSLQSPVNNAHDAYSGTLCSWQYCPSWFPWPDVLDSSPCRLELEVILESYCSRLSRLSMLLTRNSFRNPLKSRSSVSAFAAQCQCTPHAQRFTSWMDLHHTIRHTEDITDILKISLQQKQTSTWYSSQNSYHNKLPWTWAASVIACFCAMACIWWIAHTPTWIWAAWLTHLHSQLPWGHLRPHAQLPQLAAWY